MATNHKVQRGCVPEELAVPTVAERCAVAADREVALRARISEIWSMHGAGLIRYARRMAGSPETARDAVQETFLRLWKQELMHEALDPSRLAPWLYTVCRRYTIDVNRKERRMTDMQELAPADGGIADLTQLRRDAAAALDAADRLVTDEGKDAMLMALKTLSRKQEEAIRFKFHGGLSYK